MSFSYGRSLKKLPLNFTTQFLVNWKPNALISLAENFLENKQHEKPNLYNTKNNLKFINIVFPGKSISNSLTSYTLTINKYFPTLETIEGGLGFCCENCLVFMLPHYECQPLKFDVQVNIETSCNLQSHQQNKQ